MLIQWYGMCENMMNLPLGYIFSREYVMQCLIGFPYIKGNMKCLTGCPSGGRK